MTAPSRQLHAATTIATVRTGVLYHGFRETFSVIHVEQNRLDAHLDHLSRLRRSSNESEHVDGGEGDVGEKLDEQGSSTVGPGG